MLIQKLRVCNFLTSKWGRRTNRSLLILARNSFLKLCNGKIRLIKWIRYVAFAGRKLITTVDDAWWHWCRWHKCCWHCRRHLHSWVMVPESHSSFSTESWDVGRVTWSRGCTWSTAHGGSEKVKLSKTMWFRWWIINLECLFLPNPILHI